MLVEYANSLWQYPLGTTHILNWNSFLACWTVHEVISICISKKFGVALATDDNVTDCIWFKQKPKTIPWLMRSDGITRYYESMCSACTVTRVTGGSILLDHKSGLTTFFQWEINADVIVAKYYE